MSARSSFLFCVVVSAMPFAAAGLGFYHLAIVRLADSSHPRLADWCIAAFGNSVEVAGHISLLLLLPLTAWLVGRSALTMLKGWREIQQLRSLPRAGSQTDAWIRLQHVASPVGAENRTVLIDATDPFAFTMGLLAPQMVFSTALVSALEDDELEAVLRHETAHLKRHDPLRAMVIDACQRAFPFLPVVGHLAQRFRIRKEIEADAEAIAAMGSVGPLASALSKLLLAIPQSYTATPGLSPTEARIDALTGKPPSQATVSVALSGLVSLPALLVFSNATYVVTSGPHLLPLHLC